ncbi:MAG: CoA pyrophosphatase [Rhodospirillaceae bacterium]|nr:CoA pyrophosphatase [Rhodospirillaceae bacterium]
MITPDAIRKRLEVNRTAKERGDVVSGRALLAEEGLSEFEVDGFSPVPSSGIPYDQGAGAPGVKTKRMAAGVLVPLIKRDDEITVLLTRRSDELNKHGGQVAFPGGRVDDTDANQVEAAMREAHEEVGIVPGIVDVLGCLDPYLTITGFEVLPVVGLVSTPPESFTPEPSEVAAIFEVPLTFLLDQSNHQKVRRTVNGLERAYYAMPYKKHYIWGATAGMIVNLSEVLRG